jgi:hypothetical protein
MRKKLLILLFAINLILLFAFIQTAYAQSAGATTSNITGRVLDSSGKVISGAMIQIKNLQTNSTREAIAGEDGSYSLLQLPPGNYEISIMADGFSTKTSPIDLILGTTTYYETSLLASGVSDVIEVTSSRFINEARTESSTSMDAKRIADLPINQRNFLNFSLTAPRVVPDRVPGQGAAASSGLSFNGQSARQNNVSIDGLDNNETAAGSVRSTFSQEAVQEFQIVSDGYSAEFGQAFGGVINIVTKTGSNSLSGSLFGLLRNDSTSARDVFSATKPEYKQYQFGTTFGGPIKKDKIFYFTSFERLSIKQSRFVTISNDTIASIRRVGFPLSNGAIPFSLGTTTVLGRIDAKLSTNDSLYVRYNGGFTFNGAFEPFGALIADTNSGKQNLRDNSFAVINTFINPNLGLVNESRFLFSQRRQRDTPLDITGPQVQLVAPEGLVIFGRGTLLPQPRDERIYQVINNTSFLRGRNQVKFGGNFIYVDTYKFTVPLSEGGFAAFTPLNLATIFNIPGAPTLSSLQAFDPSLRTPDQKVFLTNLAGILPSKIAGFPKNLPLASLSFPNAFVQGFGTVDTPTQSTTFSAFFQDDLKITNKFLIKLGLRYDINRLTFVTKNNGNFSPRIAFSYSLKPKLNIHGAYGLFFANFISGIATVPRASTLGITKIPIVPFPFSVIPFSSPTRNFSMSNTVPPLVAALPSQLSLTFGNGQKLRASYTQQANFGIDYLIDNNTVLSLSYNYVRGLRILSQRNVNPITNPIAGDPLTSAVAGRPDGRFGDLFLFETAFDSYFNAFSIEFNRRFSKGFGFVSSYTFSKAIDNYIDIRNELQESNNPLNLRGERGLSLQDVRSRFVFSGNWEPDFKKKLLQGFKVSGLITLESGRPYNLLAGVDLNLSGDNPPGDRPQIGGTAIARNSGLTPGFASVDLRIARIVKFDEHRNLTIFFEVFNALNRVNISEVNRITPPNPDGTFNLPKKDGSRFAAAPSDYRNAFAPRQCQLGFRFSF